MRTSSILTMASALLLAGVDAQSTTVPVTGLLGDATVVSNNPVGPVYSAVLPTKEFFNPADPHGNVKGSISATAGPGGNGVAFQVSFSNLPTSGGPFLYHLHAFPVNTNASCTSTLAHLDPFIRGETPPCNSSAPATCQVGDLSGKYGKITSDPFTASYVDPYASLVPGLGSFFGNRSFVVHFANTTRITCANFALVSGGNKTTSAAPSATASSTTTSPPFPGSATMVGGSVVAAMAAGVVALFL